MVQAMGIDVGGTYIKAAIVDGEGRVLRRSRIETGASGGAEEIERRIRKVFLELSESGDVQGVGVGVPGMVRFPEGTVVRSPNIAVWSNYPAAQRLAAGLGVAVTVDNDANMAALAEAWIGAGRQAASFMMVTLGTGIGAGIVLQGRLWHGETGRAGEFGHVIVDPAGAPCGCGSRGCVERYASADGMRRIAAGMGIHEDVPRLIEMARQGQGDAGEVFRQAGSALGLALAAWFNMMDLRTVVVGGGASPSLDLLLPHARHALAAAVYGVAPDELRIIPAALGEDAGVIGSARSAMLGAGPENVIPG